MKKIYFLLVLCLMTMMAWAKPIQLEQAYQQASQFLNHGSHRVPGIKQPSLRLVYTMSQPQSQQPAFYAFNRGENEGFVLIAADDELETVLGYADEGQFVIENMPNHVQWWMERYARYVEQQMNQPTAHKIAAATASYTAVDPLLTTKWNQGEPYNNMCPVMNGESCVTGCVATCHAQILKYYNTQNNPSGESLSYRWNGQTLSVTFDSYDWDNMLDVYTGSESATKKDAVAKLMYHCGVACNMNYSTYSSAASPHTMLTAMIEYFGYDKGIETLMIDYMNMDTVLAKMNRDLLAGHPISVSADTKEDGGHSFVCDGMDAQGRVHINWGWGGFSDGYFRFINMNPDNQGIGGSISNSAYTEDVTAFIGIQPQKENKPKICVTSNVSMINKSRFNKGRVVFSLKNLKNVGIGTWNGGVSLLVYDYSKSDFKDFSWTNGSVSLNSGYYFPGTKNAYYNLSSLTDGKYWVLPMVYDTELEQYFDLNIMHSNSTYSYMEVVGDSIFFEGPSMAYDNPDEDYNETFTDCRITSGDGYIQVEALNENGAYVSLLFYTGSNTLTSDDYYISSSKDAGTVFASPGVVNNQVYASFAGYKNSDDMVLTPLWLLERGSVTVLSNNAIAVNGYNSYGRSVHIEIGDLEPVEAMEDDANQDLIAHFDACTPTISGNEARFIIEDNNIHKYANLLFHIPSGYKRLPAGVYPFSSSGAEMTVQRGRIANGYINASFIGDYWDDSLYLPVWIPGKGNATVYDNGSVKIDAKNTKGYTVDITIGEVPEPDAMINVTEEKTSTYKTLSNGQFVIIRDGKQYSILGY